MIQREKAQSIIRSILVFILLLSISSAMTSSASSAIKNIAFVTGSTDGIGLATATRLASTHKVLIHGRDDNRLKQAASKIQEAVPHAELELLNYDFSSIEATKACADYVISKFPQLHILVQNAGVFIPQPTKSLTSDGLEMTFQVNVVAPFILNCMLSPLMRRTRASRVINVSSISQGGRIKDPRHFPMTRAVGDYCNHRAYSYSKLCLAALSFEMSKRVSPEDILVVSCDPGTVNTKMLLAGWGPCGIDVEDATDEYVLSTASMDAKNHGYAFPLRVLSLS